MVRSPSLGMYTSSGTAPSELCLWGSVRHDRQVERTLDKVGGVVAAKKRQVEGEKYTIWNWRTPRRLRRIYYPI